MRTTLNIDDDVLAIAKMRAAQEDISIGEALSMMVRAGFTASDEFQTDVSAKLTGRLAFLPKRGEVITSAHVRAIADIEDV